jgi:hypothetical protein
LDANHPILIQQAAVVAGVMAAQRDHAVVFSGKMPPVALGMASNMPELKKNDASKAHDA